MTLAGTLIQLEPRPQGSKSFLSNLRKNGLIPGVIYKKGMAEQILVSAAQLPKEHTRSTVVKVVYKSKERSVLMREVQTHPLTGAPLHFDFQEVESNDKVRVHVPLKFVGLTREQEKEGLFSVQVRYLEVVGSISNLPSSIEIDVSQLKGGQSVQLLDVPMPKGIVVRTGKGKNVALASIVKIV